jgi:undecaprenyl-diphosphatase
MSAVLACSAFTGALQAVVDRDRPPRLVSLVTRGSFARPRSSSFPSTHTSNAFAFAVAASCVRPALGFPLVPFAIAIGAARVGIAHHYPSDVLAGAVIGVAFGMLTGFVVRRGRVQPTASATGAIEQPKTGP